MKTLFVLAALAAIGLLLVSVAEARMPEAGDCKLSWFDENHNGRISLSEVAVKMGAWDAGFISDKCMTKVINAWVNKTPVTGDN